MSYFNFPHTHTYDKDLGWLIEHFKKLFAQVQDLQELVDALNKLYEDIPDRIQAAIDAEIAKMEALLEAEIKKMEAALAAQTAQVNALLQSYVVQFEAMKELVGSMEQHVADIKAFAQTAYANGKIYTDHEVSKVYGYIDYQLNNLVKTWPRLWDPTDGKREDLQTILYHMWNAIIPAIRVEDFDAMQIPVETLDSMFIPVQDFDRYGDWIFFKRRSCYMISPFTGQYVPIADVVNQLAGLHMDGVTVDRVDSANFPVELVDNKMISVHEWDWTNGWFNELVTEMG